VGAGAAQGHGIIGLVLELGMEIAGAYAWHHDVAFDNRDEKSNSLRHVVDTYGDIPFKVCRKQPFQFASELRSIDPDIFITRHMGMPSWGAKLGIPTLELYDEHFGVGYQGIVNVGRKILAVLSNPVFVKNIHAHSSLPFTDWWLAQDPLSL